MSHRIFRDKAKNNVVITDKLRIYKCGIFVEEMYATSLLTGSSPTMTGSNVNMPHNGNIKIYFSPDGVLIVPTTITLTINNSSVQPTTGVIVSTNFIEETAGLVDVPAAITRKNGELEIELTVPAGTYTTMILNLTTGCLPDQGNPIPPPGPRPMILRFDTNLSDSRSTPSDTMTFTFLGPTGSNTPVYNFDYDLIYVDTGVSVDSGNFISAIPSYPVLTFTGLTPGIYDIYITADDGNFGSIYGFNATNPVTTASVDNIKMTQIRQWGDVQWNNTSIYAPYSFAYCYNLRLLATDKPILNCTNLRSFFFNTPLLGNQTGTLDISGYDFSKATGGNGSATILGNQDPPPAMGQSYKQYTTIDARNIKCPPNDCTGFFSGISPLLTTIDLRGANTEVITSARLLFGYLNNLNTINSVPGLNNFKFTTCTSFREMFRAAPGSGNPLLFAIDMTNWDIGTNAQTFQEMFHSRIYAGNDVSGIEHVNPANLINNCFFRFFYNGGINPPPAGRLTTASYDALLIKLANYLPPEGTGSYPFSNNQLGMGTSKYSSAAATAHAKLLMATTGWNSIVDGGQEP